MAEMRVPTGIAGLDKMLNGGFIRNQVILVAGAPGTGKTTYGLEFIYNGAVKYNEPGIYVTFEELPQQIYRDALSLGWDLQKLEQEGKVKILCTSPRVLQATEERDEVLGRIIKEMGAKRIAIDSISQFRMIRARPAESRGDDNAVLRKELYSLINYLKVRGMTSIFLHELPKIIGSSLKISDYGLEFLVDSVVMLNYAEVESTVLKVISILKFRGSDHEKGIKEFDITTGGIRIKTEMVRFEGLMSGTARKSLEIGKKLDKFFK